MKVRIECVETGLHEYQYIAYYIPSPRENFPKMSNKSSITGRDNKSCDLLVQEIVNDMKSKEYELIMGKGMIPKHKERILNYISSLNKRR